jgi:hypothetical protein
VTNQRRNLLNIFFVVGYNLLFFAPMTTVFF